MNNMMFSFVQSSYSKKRSPDTISSLVKSSANVPSKPVQVIRRATTKVQATPVNNMPFSGSTTLQGSMFKRIQYATAGCSACGK